MYIYIYIYIYIIQNYITNAPTQFGASVPPLGTLYIMFTNVIKIIKVNKINKMVQINIKQQKCTV